MVEKSSEEPVENRPEERDQGLKLKVSRASVKLNVPDLSRHSGGGSFNRPGNGERVSVVLGARTVKTDDSPMGMPIEPLEILSSDEAENLQIRMVAEPHSPDHQEAIGQKNQGLYPSIPIPVVASGKELQLRVREERFESRSPVAQLPQVPILPMSDSSEND